ncbi:hypothetical protein [Flavobacterium nitrogenifigens]|uniref:Uncharacterized protein n=1 Tax=Flavobacterium nitrogenifigens TaxID=1617283 RepID=A0A521CJN8_9FLAO|nr:hypothetical protein [Flavobacterium nitrogenifigens]KAF2328507.1 hypothetical protein DM397_18225 [Flavobacterium nitrogenifigens]SMO59673.1 hypothetical protein SAMN06265220_102425 [Flavobacterium nitrogenifigens]
MKKVIFIITAIVLLSCNNSKKSDVNSEKVAKKELRPFFDANIVDHYYLNFSDDDYYGLVRKDNPNAKERELIDIYEFDYPESIPKVDFEKTLLNHSYKKSKLSIKKQKEIEDIFSEKDSLMKDGYACSAQYRDIFIFKKKEKTVGIAKICFECGRFQIIGSKIDTQYFGLFEELDKLHNIVRPNEKTLEP